MWKLLCFGSNDKIMPDMDVENRNFTIYSINKLNYCEEYFIIMEINLTKMVNRHKIVTVP